MWRAGSGARWCRSPDVRRLVRDGPGLRQSRLEWSGSRAVLTTGTGNDAGEGVLSRLEVPFPGEFVTGPGGPETTLTAPAAGGALRERPATYTAHCTT